MYELVKKKSTLVRIAYGIIFILILSTVLKIVFKEPNLSIDTQLMNIAKEINKQTPIPVDSLVTLENAVALSGKIFQYNYSIKAEKENIDTSVIKLNSHKALLNTLKTDPKAAYFRDNNVEIRAKYVDKNSVYLCLLKIPYSEYQ